MKTCSICKEIKDLSSFHNTGRSKDGKHSMCKPCLSNRQKNKFYDLEYRRKYEKKQRAINPGKFTAKVIKYLLSKDNRTPKWLTSEQLKQIQQFYIDSSYLTHYTKTRFEVDHIIPLRGKLISGLHVPWNLQLLTKSSNAIKSNKMEPKNG